VVARELTKLHEQIVSANPQEVYRYFEENPEKVRGEFVVMVSGGK
jgi:16S rRNA (cytidine1402-2'-O)-methyltransferase